jgi:segregation and condensation protein A
MEDYQVRLEFFEGPMDLLVYLIRKNDIDIYDIPIALIADQYLDYVTRIETLNLEKAGDFLLMAATLLQIKSRMLLPGPEIEGEEFADPRTELVEKILEYMQFKEIAEKMRCLEDLSGSQAERGFSEVEFYRAQEDGEKILKGRNGSNLERVLW